MRVARRTRLTNMRLARLLRLIVAVLIASVLLAPHATATPPLALSGYVTDDAAALSAGQLAEVRTAVDQLYTANRTRLWVVYVPDFSGQPAETWARNTMRISDFQDNDVLLAVATTGRAYAFIVPPSVAPGVDVDTLRRQQIEPLLRDGNWSGAAIAAARGLNPPPAEVPWLGLLVFLALVVLAAVTWVLWRKRVRRRRREAEFAAARRLDPTDPAALAALNLDTLDDLSRAMVVDVDNAVRTSDNELTLAIEEFGTQDTAPFTTAVEAAKTTLTQAFNVRQILDDAVPETPSQRRDLLTRVVVAAAKADRELEARRESFQQLRDLVINAPSRLDALTQQMVDLTARLEPARQTLATLHTQFAESALASVSDNVDTAQQRLTFADQNITNARALVARPAGSQSGLVDAVRAAESAVGQARILLDAVDSAATDINRAVAGLPAAIADLQSGIDQAEELIAKGNIPAVAKLNAARDAAEAAVAAARDRGAADPLGTFTQLTKADAELDRLLADAAEERATAERLSRAYDQALFTAQSRVRAVSDFIDTRRGSIGSEARTRLAEAVRQLNAAQAKQSTDLATAIAHANGAARLATEAQSLANADLTAAQQSYMGRYGGGSGSDMGAVLGGIVIGNLLSGALRGGFGGGFGGSGGWSSTTFGGSGGGYRGGGGRF